jgi:hypothetical protein
MPHLNVTFNLLAQVAHVCAGMAIVYTLYALEVRKWDCFALLVIFAAIKESIWDVLFETSSVAGNGFEDFTFFLIGGFLAVLVLTLTRRYVWRRI